MASRNETIRGEVSPILSTFAKGYRNANMIAKNVAPVIPSLTEAGTLYSFGKEGFMVYDTNRALRAATKKMDFAISKDTYVCTEHALETSLDYKELEIAEKIGAGRVLQLEQRAMNVVNRALEVELEKAVADIMFSSTYYASGNYTTLSGTSQWSDTSNSDPIGNIDTGKTAARADMGVEPNVMVIGYSAWQTLKNHPAIIDKIKYSMKAVITEDLVAEILGLDAVYVGKAVYSTDAGVFTSIWGDNAALVYVPMGEGEMVEGTTPHTVIVEEEGYPQVTVFDAKKTRDYELTRKYAVKNIDTGFGYLILDVTA